MTRVLVTGGGGFLGGHIVRQLLERGDHVGSLTRSAQPELKALGVRAHRGDISDAQSVSEALAHGYEAVIHAAAMVNPWGNREAFYRANVTGTQVLLRQSRQAGVKRFVFTSSPSAVFDGHDLIHATPERAPYPTRFPSAYGETKALSEQDVMAAHDPEGGFVTVSLRPQLIWGPGDPHLLPLLIERARAGTLRQIGAGRARVDLTYVDNAARAHLDALDALGGSPGSPNYPGGEVYFISNGEPVELWAFIREILALSGEPGPKGRIPAPLARLVGRACEALWQALGRDDEPPVSEFVVLKMHAHQWYDMEPARRDLGYVPEVSMEEGKRRWQAWYASHRLPDA